MTQSSIYHNNKTETLLGLYVIPQPFCSATERRVFIGSQYLDVFFPQLLSY